VRVKVIVRDDGSNAEIHRGDHHTAVEPQRGDRLIHVVIDGYHAPVVDVREHDLDGASPFLRVRCRATRRSAGGEA
jgi:hypothetical protein